MLVNCQMPINGKQTVQRFEGWSERNKFEVSHYCSMYICITDKLVHVTLFS